MALTRILCTSPPASTSKKPAHVNDLFSVLNNTKQHTNNLRGRFVMFVFQWKKWGGSCKIKCLTLTLGLIRLN